MISLYPFIISFILIFISELGDKTQFLVLSFSPKNKSKNILLGVALGTLFSHGLAIIFGTRLGIIENKIFIYYLKALTYGTFLLLGIVGFFKQKKSTYIDKSAKNNSTFINFINTFTKNCVIIVAVAIAIGEIGDKTFLSSIGLGVQYPLFKIPLILGSVCGMVASNSIAIFFGKYLSSKVADSAIENLSNLIFILFGLIGFFTL